MVRSISIILINIFLFVACDTSNNVDSPFEKRFVKFYGGEGDQEGIDFISLADGSFIILGNSILEGSASDQQIMLMKVNQKGDVVWEKIYGAAGKKDIARDIELTSDNRILIAGETYNDAIERDVYLKIVTTDGNELDSLRTGLLNNQNQPSDEEVNSISIIQDGFIISGKTSAVEVDTPGNTYDGMHLKFTNSLVQSDPSGGLWSNSTGFSSSEEMIVKTIQVAPDLYYGFGYTNAARNNNSDFKYWIFSIGETGESTNLGEVLLDGIGSVNRDDFLEQVIESPAQSAEGFVLSGISVSSNGAAQSMVVKVQKELFQKGEDNVLAEEYPANLGNDVLITGSIVNSVMGGYLLIVNDNNNPNQASNISLIKLSNTCQLEWQAPIYFGGVGDDFGGAVQQLADGRILILGTMTLGGATGQRGQKKIVLMKLDNKGRLLD